MLLLLPFLLLRLLLLSGHLTPLLFCYLHSFCSCSFCACFYTNWTTSSASCSSLLFYPPFPAASASTSASWTCSWTLPSSFSSTFILLPFYLFSVALLLLLLLPLFPSAHLLSPPSAALPSACAFFCTVDLFPCFSCSSFTHSVVLLVLILPLRLRLVSGLLLPLLPLLLPLMSSFCCSFVFFCVCFWYLDSFFWFVCS